MTPEMVNEDKLRVMHLIISKDDNFPDSFIVLDTLIKKRNQLLSKFQEHDQMERLCLLKTSEENLRLPTTTELTKIVQDHGMSDISFKKQQQVLFNFEAINSEFLEMLLPRIRFIYFTFDEKQAFHFFDQIQDWETLNRFEAKLSKKVPKKKVKRKIDTILENKPDIRLEILISSLWLMRQDWTKKQLSLTIDSAVKQINKFCFARLDEILEIDLKSVLFLFERIEASLFTFYIENRLPSCFKMAFEETQTRELTQWLEEFDDEDSLCSILGKLVARNHGIFTFAIKDLSLREFLNECPLSDEINELEDAEEMFELFDSIDLKVYHFVSLHSIIQEYLDE